MVGPGVSQILRIWAQIFFLKQSNYVDNMLFKYVNFFFLEIKAHSGVFMGRAQASLTQR